VRIACATAIPLSSIAGRFWKNTAENIAKINSENIRENPLGVF
jgi:hypothetical protein